MNNIKTIIVITMTTLIMQSCEKEKITVQKIDGYIFSYNPKNSTKYN